jgi:hypothetical protein
MNEDTIDQLVSMLLSTVELDAVPGPDPGTRTWPIAARVPIRGSSPLTLHVGLTPEAALRLSGLITGLTAHDLRADPSLQQDLAHEVANVLAGNIWPVLPGATGIGLPQGGPLPTCARGTARVYSIDGVPAFAVALCEQQG